MATLIKSPLNLLGKSLAIYMKDGGVFFFKPTEAGNDYINGYDEEGMSLRIYVKDIEKAVEVSV